MKAVFDRVCMRTLVTIFMFVGVILFLLPYFSEGRVSGLLFLILGSAIALGCGFLRCYLDENCGDKAESKRVK